MLSESSKSLIQKEIQKEYGINSRVYQDEETGNIYIKRLAKVCKRPVGVNQIDIADAKIVSPKAKYGDFVELDFESNAMLEEIISNCIETSSKAEEIATEKARLVESLRSRGVVYYSLIFAKFVNKTMLGEAQFKYDNLYDVYIDADKQIKGEEYKEDYEYPMIVTSFNFVDSNNKIEIRASRVTANLVEELVRLTLVNCNYRVEVKGVVREPGVLSKVIVDVPQINEINEREGSNLSASGIVVGLKGCNVKKVESYLSGEKIEIINYRESTPYQIASIVGESDVVGMYFYFQNPDVFPPSKYNVSKRVLVIVTDKNIGRVIGKGGVSLKLNNRLSGWSINVMSESDFNQRLPHGFVDTSSFTFDWCDYELPEISKVFYGYYLSKLGMNSITDLEGLEADDLDVKEFTDGDKQFLLNLSNEIDFNISCPVCGREVENYATVCPFCGASFED